MQYTCVSKQSNEMFMKIARTNNIHVIRVDVAMFHSHTLSIRSIHKISFF